MQRRSHALGTGSSRRRFPWKGAGGLRERCSLRHRDCIAGWKHASAFSGRTGLLGGVRRSAIRCVGAGHVSRRLRRAATTRGWVRCSSTTATTTPPSAPSSASTPSSRRPASPTSTPAGTPPPSATPMGSVRRTPVLREPATPRWPLRRRRPRPRRRRRRPGLSDRWCNWSGWSLVVGIVGPQKRRPSKVIANALSAGFQRFIQRSAPVPLGSSDRTTR